MINTNFDASAFVQPLGWAILHSLWQALLLLMLVKTLLVFIPSRKSGLRYRISLLGLIVSTIWFIDTWVRSWKSQKLVSISVTETSGHLAGETKMLAVSPQYAGAPDILVDLYASLQPLMPFVVSFYAFGLMAFLLRFCYNLYYINHLRHRGIFQAPFEIMEQLKHWQAEIGISTKVRLLLSDKVRVPVVMGTIKPLILFPVATMNHLSMEQAEAILLHELAHIKRYDYLVNMLQTVVETLLFFNPAVWLLSRMIRIEREHCCDDIVLAHAYPMAYAKALASLEQHRIDDGRLVLGATGNSKKYLLTRIKRIMEPRTKNNMKSPGITILLLLVAACLTTFSFSLGFAQSKEKKGQGQKKAAVSNDSVKAQKNTPVPPKPPIPPTTTKNGSITPPPAPKAPSAANGDHVPAPPAPPVVPDVDALVEEAMSKIDFEEIGQSVEQAMEEIDWAEIGKEIDEGLKEAEKALKEIDWEEIQQSFPENGLDSTTRIKIKSDVNKAVAERREAIKTREKALLTKEIKHRTRRAYATAGSVTKNQPPYAKMLDRMERDGLIDRKSGYKVQKKNGKLYINGKKQTEHIYKKYNSYLNAQKFKISGDENSFSMDISK